MAGPPAPPPLPPAPPPPTLESVTQEIQSQIAAQTAPLESMAAGYGNAENRAIEQLNQLYAGIMPFVQGSAERVASQYGATTAAQQGIFNQAYQRMNDLRGQRAAEAQALAQQIGAPVPLDSYTQGLDIERQVFAPESAGDLLHGQGLAQAGVQEAEAFAGKVFPLHQVRMQNETHQYFRDKIWELNQQIANIKSQSSSIISKEFKDRQLQYYQLQLDRTQLLYDQWKSKQDVKFRQKEFALTKRQQLKAEKQQKFENVMTKKGFLLEKQRFNAQKLQFAQQMGLSMKELDAKIANDKWARTHGATQLADKQRYLQKVDQITSVTDSLLTGVAPTYKTIKVKDAYGNEKIKTVIDTPGTPGIGAAGPMKVLRTLMAKVGISQKSNPRLYRQAVQQVISSYQAAGYTSIGSDPSKWKQWWKNRTQRGNVQMGPPAPPGSVEWVWDRKKGRYVKIQH